MGIEERQANPDNLTLQGEVFVTDAFQGDSQAKIAVSVQDPSGNFQRVQDSPPGVSPTDSVVTVNGKWGWVTPLDSIPFDVDPTDMTVKVEVLDPADAVVFPEDPERVECRPNCRRDPDPATAVLEGVDATEDVIIGTKIANAKVDFLLGAGTSVTFEPDLVATKRPEVIVPPRNINPGDTITVKWAVRNAGDGPAFGVEYQIEVDGFPLSPDQTIARVPAGEEVVEEVEVTLPDSIEGSVNLCVNVLTHSVRRVDTGGGGTGGLIQSLFGR